MQETRRLVKAALTSAEYDRYKALLDTVKSCRVAWETTRAVRELCRLLSASTGRTELLARVSQTILVHS